MYYKVLGMMSGTSLDGLDMAYCEFNVKDADNVDFTIKKAVTIPYNDDIRKQIIDCETKNGEYLYQFSAWLGRYFGLQAKKFISDNALDVHLIASHGQTIFHQPFNGFTTQIGDINQIAAQTQCTVIGDFRSLDVALGGQGAPLVPIGDKVLFANYGNCLNIGGFSNISFDKSSQRFAYDICPVNIVINYLSQTLGYPYDKDGDIAKAGHVNRDLLNDLNQIPYYINKETSSLGKEFVKKYVFPLLNKYSLSTEDKIATYTEHAAVQIAENINGRTLVTGGGAYNTFLINKIKEKSVHEIVIPDNTIVEYKEALIFAFLGLRRLRNEINCLASVTGAVRDCSSGLIANGK